MRKRRIKIYWEHIYFLAVASIVLIINILITYTLSQALVNTSSKDIGSIIAFIVYLVLLVGFPTYSLFKLHHLYIQIKTKIKIKEKQQKIMTDPGMP